jgi:hypothetical protein
MATHERKRTLPCTCTGIPLRFVPAGDGHVKRALALTLGITRVILNM